MKLLSPLFVLLICLSLFAQPELENTKNDATAINSQNDQAIDNQEHNLLDTPVHHGFYGAPVLKSATIGPQNANAMLAAAQIGWILNKKYVVGLNITGLASRVKAPKIPEVDGLVMITNYGGLYLSYIHDSHRLIHFEAGGTIGIGQVFYRDSEYRARYNDIDAFIMIEPEVRVMMNIIPGFRMGAGLSYRLANRVNLLGQTNGDLSGVSANLILKIGKF